jgi:hypothetical protein
MSGEAYELILLFIQFELDAVIAGEGLHVVVLMIPDLVGNPLGKGIACEGTWAAEVLAPHTYGRFGNHGSLSIVRESSPASTTTGGNASGLRSLLHGLELKTVITRERGRVGITME